MAIFQETESVVAKHCTVALFNQQTSFYINLLFPVIKITCTSGSAKRPESPNAQTRLMVRAPRLPPVISTVFLCRSNPILRRRAALLILPISSAHRQTGQYGFLCFDKEFRRFRIIDHHLIYAGRKHAVCHARISILLMNHRRNVIQTCHQHRRTANKTAGTDDQIRLERLNIFFCSAHLSH